MSNKLKKKNIISPDQRKDADDQLNDFQKIVDYDTKDFTVELIVDKFKKGDFFVPDYQRGFIWRDSFKVSFIESVLLGLPIPFMFVGDCEDGKMEIIDGVQRINTLSSFFNDLIVLREPTKLTKLDGYTFSDLSMP